MEKFEYGYYLENMIGKTEIEEIDEKISPLMFGSIIHSVYEKIVKENKERCRPHEGDEAHPWLLLLRPYVQGVS